MDECMIWTMNEPLGDDIKFRAGCSTHEWVTGGATRKVVQAAVDAHLADPLSAAPAPPDP